VQQGLVTAVENFGRLLSIPAGVVEDLLDDLAFGLQGGLPAHFFQGDRTRSGFGALQDSL